MKKVLYIGEIPYNFGGITRKSEILERELKEFNHTNVINIDVKHHKRSSFIISLIKILLAMKSSEKIIYCLDNKRILLLLKIQYLFYKEKLENTTVVISGGEFHDFLMKDVSYIKKVGNYWIEIQNAIRLFLEEGYKNVVYYPNPRIQQISFEPTNYDGIRPLKLLFYSQISKEKGLLDVIEIVKVLNSNRINYELDFYGWIVDDVKELFNDFVDKTDNVTYKGFNDANNSKDYFSLINNYDVMLFPTYWHGEGIAGACVEAKISGVTIIASNHNYNKEIVIENNNEGFIIDKGDINAYVNCIMNLYNNPDLLNIFKKGSFESRKRFDVNTYLNLFKL